MSLIKRLFVFSLVITTVLWSFGGLTIKAEAAGSYGAGSLLALEGVSGSAVYYIGSDGDKYVFPDGKTYSTWYDNFNDVVKVDVAELDMYDDGGAMTYRAGTKLVTHANTAKVYAVGPGGLLHWIPTAEVAEDLYGANWGSRVLDAIPGYFSSSYVSGSDLSDMYPDGTLLQMGEDMYYVMDGDVRPFADADAFEVNNFDYDNLIEVDDVTAYGTGESITGEETGLSGFMPADPIMGGGGVAAGELSVSLATDTPAAGIAYKSSTHVSFTKVKLTAGSDPVTIDSLILERTGVPASDNTFTGVNVMLEDNTLLASSYKSLNSDHQATFTDDVVIPANSSVYLTLVGKMSAFAATYQGEMPALSLVEINTDASVSASLPIIGNPMATNASITIGVLTVTETPNLGAVTEEVGTTDFEFLNVKLANDSATADLRIDSIRFNNAGSADDADVDNLALTVDGNVVATGEMVSNYVIFDLSDCDVCTIADGKNETFKLIGDIVGGSARTLDFDIKKVDDIMAYDLLNATYVTPDAAIDGARIVTISRGTLNVSKTNDVSAHNVAEDTADLSLASWNFKVAGEPITISTIKFDIDVSGTVSSTDFTKLKLVDSDGNSLTGTQAGADSGSSDKDASVTFSDSFTLPIGNNIIKMMGTLSADAANNDTVTFAVDFSSTGTSNLDATGDTTGDAITIGTYAFPNAEVAANLITITDLAMSVVTLPSPAAQTIAAGVIDHLYTKVRFDATDSSEDIKVTAFEFYLTASATAKTNEIQNITFVVDGTELSITKNGSGTSNGADEEISVSLSGADQFTVAKGTAVNMLIYADLTAGATEGGTHKMDITSTNANVVTSQGATSGNTVNAAEGTATSKAMTVGAAGGQIEVSLDSSNPEATIFAGGTTVDLADFKFYATSTENVELDYLYLTQVETDVLSSSFEDYDELWFVDEAGIEILGTRMTPTSTKPRINFADDAFAVDYTDTNGVVLTLKGKLAAIGSGQNGTSGNIIGYKINASVDVVAKGAMTGSASNEYISTSAAPTGNTNYMYKGYPIFARVNMTNSLTNGTKDLYKWTVTAVNNDIGLYKFTFDIVTTVVTVTNFYVYDVTGTHVALDTAATQATGDVTGTAGQVITTVATNWDGVYATPDEATVAQGATRTFVLRGDVTGSGTGASVQVRLAGDAAVVTAAATMLLAANDVDSDVNDDFIWSDKSVGSHSDTTADWVNGFLVSGLTSPSTSAQVISY